MIVRLICQPSHADVTACMPDSQLLASLGQRHAPHCLRILLIFEVPLLIKKISLVTKDNDGFA